MLTWTWPTILFAVQVIPEIFWTCLNPEPYPPPISPPSSSHSPLVHFQHTWPNQLKHSWNAHDHDRSGQQASSSHHYNLYIPLCLGLVSSTIWPTPITFHSWCTNFIVTHPSLQLFLYISSLCFFDFMLLYNVDILYKKKSHKTLKCHPVPAFPTLVFSPICLQLFHLTCPSCALNPPFVIDSCTLAGWTGIIPYNPHLILTSNT